MKTKLLLLVVVMSIINCQNVLAQGSRMIGLSSYGYGTSSYVLYDSTAYFYTGSHGGDLNRIKKFTTDTLWNYSGSSFTPGTVLNQTFDGADNIATTTYLNYVSGNFVKVSLYTNTYNVSHNNTSTLVQNWDPGTSTWKDSLKSDHVYDASNNIISNIDYQWSTASSAFVPSTRDTTIFLGATAKVITFFNWSSPTPTGNWVNVLMDTLYYDGSGYETSQVSYGWYSISSIWVKNIHELIYNNTMGKPVTDTEYSWTGTSWKNSSIDNYTYDASGNILTDKAIIWSGTAWVNSLLSSYTFNSSHQMTSVSYLYWDATSGSFNPTAALGDAIYYYYYESYVNTGMAPLNNLTVDVNIFPNPANKILQLRINWDKPEPFDVSVYDMNGRIMSSQHEDAITTYNRQIPVTYWPVGNYSVVIKTNSGSTTKQFIVRH